MTGVGFALYSPITYHHSPALFLKGIVLRQRLDPAEQILFVRHSCDLIAELAVLKEEQRGNRANVVLVRKTLVLVDVDLRDLDRAGFFFRDLVQKGGDHFAGPAPFRPEIDNHWLVALGYFTLKICLVEIDRYRILHYPK